VLFGMIGSIIGIFIRMPSFGDFPAFTGFMAKGIIAPGSSPDGPRPAAARRRDWVAAAAY
jgi:hypothetical protein